RWNRSIVRLCLDESSIENVARQSRNHCELAHTQSPGIGRRRLKDLTPGSPSFRIRGFPANQRGASMFRHRSRKMLSRIRPRGKRRTTAFRFGNPNLEDRTLLSLQAGLVSDINRLPTSPLGLTNANGQLFFLTENQQQSSTGALWTSKGTGSG